MVLFDSYARELIMSVVLTVTVFILRIGVAKLVRRYAKSSQLLEHRTNLVIKYNHILITTLYFIALFIIWGVQTKDVFLTVSSVVTVVGAALFAQWSILSNITSGIILLFSFPFKIGDIIRIHDKDFPIEAEIEDIRTFHTYLKTKDGEMITYPNTLLLQKGISIISHYTYNEKEFTD